jgi:non-heme Fe2+,alpha-ketoglutarate-dependent halogenase
MTASLSASAVERYHARGYHFPVPVFTAAEATALHDRLRAIEARSGGRFERWMNRKPHLIFPWLDAVVRDPRILDAIEAVIGPNILCWNSQFFAKKPGDGAFVSWHQDATYWGLSEPDVVTAWVAFTPSMPESGCMRVVPGTHLAQVAHTDTFDDKNLLTRGQEVAAKVEERDAVDVILQPGEMSLHHVLIVHGSSANASAQPRVGFAIRYIPTYVRQIVGEADCATLVRGVDSHKHFELETAPKSELDPDDVARLKRMIERQQKILYAGAAQAGRRIPT